MKDDNDFPEELGIVQKITKSPDLASRYFAGNAHSFIPWKFKMQLAFFNG